jgi:hypothetical protein
VTDVALGSSTASQTRSSMEKSLRIASCNQAATWIQMSVIQVSTTHEGSTPIRESLATNLQLPQYLTLALTHPLLTAG